MGTGVIRILSAVLEGCRLKATSTVRGCPHRRSLAFSASLPAGSSETHLGDPSSTSTAVQPKSARQWSLTAVSAPHSTQRTQSQPHTKWSPTLTDRNCTGKSTSAHRNVRPCPHATADLHCAPYSIRKRGLQWGPIGLTLLHQALRCAAAPSAPERATDCADRRLSSAQVRMYTTRKTRCSAAYEVQPGEHIQASTRHYEMHCRMHCKRRTTAAWRNATFHSPAWAQARASPTRTDKHLDDELLVGHTIAHLAVRAHQRAITRRERRDLRQRVCLQHASGQRPMAVMALAAKAACAPTTNTQPSAGKRGRRRTGRQVGSNSPASDSDSDSDSDSPGRRPRDRAAAGKSRRALSGSKCFAAF